MSIALFRERLGKSRLHPDDIKWMPRWLQEFARNHPESNGSIRFSDPDVLKFLQQLRDRKVPAARDESTRFGCRKPTGSIVIARGVENHRAKNGGQKISDPSGVLFFAPHVLPMFFGAHGDVKSQARSDVPCASMGSML